MAQSTTGSYGTTPTVVPEGLEPVPQSNYPEAIQQPATYEKGVVSPSPAPQPNPPATYESSAPEKKICGLRRTTFLLLALLILVIVAAAVGGGVGGSVAVRNAYDRGRTESGRASSGSPIQAPPQTGEVALNCPLLTDTEHEINGGAGKVVFRATCGVNHASSGGAEDLARLVAYTFDDCFTACAAFNDLDATNKSCVAAHFNTKLMNKAGGNCWLKSKIGKSEIIEGDRKNHLVEGYPKD